MNSGFANRRFLPPVYCCEMKNDKNDLRKPWLFWRYPMLEVQWAVAQIHLGKGVS
jgi:hypothetical protein